MAASPRATRTTRSGSASSAPPSGVTTLYAYDEAGHLAGEYTSTGALIQETVWLGDMPVATLRPNGSGGVILYYVHADHLNTPRLVTDTSNNIRWRWDSDPFGTTIPNENPSSLGVFAYNLQVPGAAVRRRRRAALQLLQRLRSGDGAICRKRSNRA